MSEAGADAAVRFARGLCEDPPGAVARWKAVSGGSAVGLVAARVPTEIVAAAGMLPVTLWGDEIPSPQGAAGPFHFPCSAVRTVAASLRAGGWAGVLDALVLPTPCDAQKKAPAGPGEEDGLPVFRIGRSARVRGGGLEGLLDLFEALAEWAGTVCGGPVREGALDKAVRRENERRRLFETLARRTSETPGLFSAAEYFAVARAGMLLPAAVHGEVLRAVLGREKPRRKGGPRIFLAGTMAPGAVFDRLDEAGALFVGDGLASGSGFYLEGPAEEGKDPLLSLARRQAGRGERVGVAVGGELGAEAAAARAAACGAQGMILVQIRVCGAKKNIGDRTRREALQRGVAFLRLEADSLVAAEEWSGAIGPFTAGLR